MNILRRGFSIFSSTVSSLAVQTCNVLPKPVPAVSTITQHQPVSALGQRLWDTVFGRDYATLARMHRTGPYIKTPKKRKPLDGKPFMKGIILKTLIKKPKKPNSANRKCVLVKLSNGKEMVAYVPGIGHNLQEHNIVLCRVGRVKDCPGVKIKCVRGKYDLPHVVKVDTS